MIDVPHEPLSARELNAMGALAVQGDQAAADRIVKAFVDPIAGWADEIAKKQPVLERWRDEIAADGLLILARRLKDYDPARGDLLPFVVANVKKGMARESKKWLATNGAHVATGGGGKWKRPPPPDYKTNPCFQATCTLSPFDPAPDPITTTDSRLGPRWKLMMRLRGLDPWTKEVFLTVNGVPLRQPTQDGHAWEAAQAIGEEGVASVAASYGTPVAEIEAALRRAREWMSRSAGVLAFGMVAGFLGFFVGVAGGW